MSSVFISYSHKDQEILGRLLVHLKPLKRKGTISVFSDKDIRTDEQWRKRIADEIDSASVGLLLVSADFLASDFICDKELPKLFEGRNDAKKKLITVFVSPSNYKVIPEIESYQAFNDPQKPLSSLGKHETEELFVRLVEEVASSMVGPTASDESNPNDQIHFEKLPEVDYNQMHGQKLFSNVKVQIPALLTALDSSKLIGFSFDKCWLLGPAVIYAAHAHIEGNTFGVAEKDVHSLFLKPTSKHLLGVVEMDHLNISNSQITNISFVDPDGGLASKMKADLKSSEKMQ